MTKNKEHISGNTDCYGEYMHLYESVCGYTDDNGAEGRQALMKGLNELKKEQVEIITQQQGVSTSGFVSMPATSTKKVDKRIQSRCSPKKKK